MANLARYMRASRRLRRLDTNYLSRELRFVVQPDENRHAAHDGQIRQLLYDNLFEGI